ncbi:MAG: methyltransferase domain-containing protein [Thaumarchaeota archaeon]|nr:methyltransferase domain-containing protein [Nitrososphaerota archaeon]
MKGKDYVAKSADFLRKIEHHFTEIAPRYRSLRTTDIEPILFIEKELGNAKKIHGADIGCGAGRYTLRLAKHLGKKCHLLYCIDKSENMLVHLKDFFVEHGINHFKTLHSDAHKIPLKTDSLDFVVSFNAVHHFDMPDFLKETSRILKNGSRLFVYTRLKNQNARNIWGMHFPNFAQKETRLYDLNELEDMIENTANLNLKSIRFFEYPRVSSLARLEEQARGYHYSTFRLFSKKEFDSSLETFKRNIMEHYPDHNKITWKDQNVLLVIEC